jgi:hypothetical protein
MIMNTSKLIEILRWPSTKRNGMNPWYVILWRLCFIPFMFLFGLGYYLTILLSTLSFYQAETFRKDYWF